jgi:propionyl-CoA synthetase
MPFAFIQLHPSADSSEALSTKFPPTLFREVNKLVREQIGSIASLGGMIQGQRIIPKTRSGKILRRVLRDLVEQAVVGQFDTAISMPPTIEDPEVVDMARRSIGEYFEDKRVKAKL